MKKKLYLLLALLLAAAVIVTGALLLIKQQETAVTAPETPVLKLADDLSVYWDRVENAQCYIIEVNGSDLASIEGTTFPALSASGTYTIRVRSVNQAGKSDYSNEVSYQILSVTLPHHELYTVLGNPSVGYGKDYTFSLELAEGCTQCKPVVKVNGQVVTPDAGGKYTVESVTEELTVTVEGVELNAYGITLPTGTGYTLSGEPVAYYGKDYTFTLTLDERYSKSQPVVKANGVELTLRDGSYVIENVTKPQNITVTGVSLNTYTVNLTTGRGYQISPSGAQTVSYGGSITFTVTPASPSYGITVKADGKTLSGDSGTYTISNITSNVRVTVTVSGLPALSAVEKILDPKSWNAVSATPDGDSLIVSASSVLKASYLRDLWAEGYTHLVFTVNAKAVDNMNYTHGGDWSRYWANFDAAKDVDIRIDLNEFHDGDTWYNLNFNSGNMTVSNPRAYKSAETLGWTKSRTNIYFAIEDGYYVLETRANDDSVTSPTQWLKKYVVADDVSQRSWLMYTDYLKQGSNTRSMLWGWGSAVNVINGDVNGGWSWNNNVQTDGYTDGEVFSLHLDHSGTARFKLLDWVSNRNGWNEGFSFAYIDDQTFKFSTDLNGHVFRLASTNELVEMGYKALEVTLTGNLGENILWYGNGDWNGGMHDISANKLSNGSYTFRVELSELEGELFQLHASVASGAITEMQVTVRPVELGTPVKVHQVTLPAGEGFTATGKQNVRHGESYSFAVDLTVGYDPDKVVVKANGKELTQKDGLYTIDAVTENVTVTVEQVQLIRYPVTLPVDKAFQAEGSTYAEYGRDYTFKIVMSEGYTERQAMIFVNGQVLAPVNGEYVVKSVKNALTVTAELSEPNSWIVLIPDGSRYTVTPSGKQNVLDNESLSFTVIPNADDAKVEVTANGKKLTGEGGVYTLRNVQENIIVEISANTMVDEAMLAENWLSNSAVQTQDDLTLAANPSLKAEYLKSLWNAGYTHLVFTMNASTGGNFIHGGTWDRYWDDFSAGTRDVRIDLNEFCVDNTWYDLSFINMTGDMTVSEPRAYKSTETLGWTKSRTNIYFAIEDGYYVLETRANDDYVTSPTQWLKKYVVKDDASQRSWLMYTDYLNQGSNTRSMLWGWGSAVNTINVDVNGGWSWNNGVQTDGYTDGEVFSLHLDHGGTARFKLLDWVSNRNEWNSDLAISYVDEQTIRWSAAEGYKLRLATTQDLIADGYTTLQVTLTGSLGSALIWYGDDDWSDGEIAVRASDFVDGSYTFEVDLTAFTSDETFTLLANAAAFTDVQVSIQPVTKTAYSVSLPTGLGYRVQGEPAAYQGSSYSFTLTLDEGYTQSSALVKVNGVHLDGTDGVYTVENVQEDLTITVEGVQLNTYTVTKAEGEGFTISGADIVTHGASYTFQVALDDPNTQLVVLVNGSVVTGTNGSYTVERVTANLTITVQATLPEPDFPETVILNTASWTAASLNDDGSLSTGALTQLSSAALKQLWDEGYTHLVFTVNAKAASDNNTNYTHSGTWSRYWSTFDAAKDVDIRIDLNEFHDGDTWYNLNFNAGNMTVSNPRAYKSAETLDWTKSSTNCYFAIEDGYYVLETHANDVYVTSPTQWLKKYVVADDASQRSWLMYTDYLKQGSNTRSMLWGWGSAVNVINGDVNGGWSWNNNVQTDGYTDGEVFSLHLDHNGTARFKLLDWVSNRNEWNNALALSYVDAQTIRWSAAEGYKLRLATTQDLIADGYTTLKVTLTGDLGSAIVWYGDDDWSDGEIAVDAEKFVDGAYTFEVDLTAFTSEETFTLLANAAAITDLLVKIEPVQGDNPAVIYNVTAPTGEGYTFTGAETVLEGTNYSFTVMPNDGVTVTVKVNGKVINGENGSYTVENVTSNLVITVETKALTTVKKLLTANNWSNGGTVGDGTLIVPASSSLKADYMKALWDEGYTHLVFTVNAEAVDNMNYTHGGTWSRYWANFDAAADVDIRIDLNEFHDGDTWYNLNFNTGNMTVSNPRAYKSAETLDWIKSSTNSYFAIENGYYVLETHGNDSYVKSPTQWLKKYVVKDDASQRSWLMYTDYITQSSNTRSMLWGWGNAVNVINDDINGGWSWNNNVQTDGYTDGEVFSLHLDHKGTARFKLLDWVSNRNGWNSRLAISYVDAQTIRWSAAEGYKLRLATTQDLIADGYTALKVTLTGDLGSALVWYGDDDWSDGEIGVSADKFVDGSYTFEVDLTAFTSNETFTLLANAADITDLLVKIEPLTE